jgi:hypothetical protein
LAEIVAMFSTSAWLFTGMANPTICSASQDPALSMPRFMDTGAIPADRYFMPSANMNWASTVAVVVPSPASSLVLDATSLTRRAPMFSQGSESSISLATLTPSFVTTGFPNALARATFRPRGPKVIATVLAS